MPLVRGDLLGFAIVLIAVGVMILVVGAPFPLIYIAYIVLVAGAAILVYWIYKQATGGGRGRDV